MARLLLLLLLTACTNDRPWKVIEVRAKGDACEYVLSRSNGFGPQVKTLTDTCGAYKLFQTLNLWNYLTTNPTQKTYIAQAYLNEILNGYVMSVILLILQVLWVKMRLNRNYTLVLTVDALRCTKGISANSLICEVRPIQIVSLWSYRKSPSVSL